MRYRQLLHLGIVLLFLCALTGCSAGSGNIVLTSGVQGQATRGPIAPVAQSGQPNDAPFPGVTIALQRSNGSEVARQRTDAQGNFKINAAPGTYQVVGLAPNGNAPPTPQSPQAVIVVANQYATVNVSYDTGIR